MSLTPDGSDLVPGPWQDRLTVQFDGGTRSCPVMSIGRSTFSILGNPIHEGTEVHVTFVVSALLSVTVRATAGHPIAPVVQGFVVDSNFEEVLLLAALALDSPPGDVVH
jgi:hypothetical protein